MNVILLKSKIHAATVTESNLNYEGSLTLDSTLMEAANLLAGERVQVLNLNNGSRIETYIIEGKKDSGTACRGQDSYNQLRYLRARGGRGIPIYSRPCG